MNMKNYLLGLILFVALFSCKDDEEPPVQSQIKFTSDKSAFENQSNAVFEFEVKLNQSSDQTVTVDYETSDFTATSGEDYEATTGTLTFSPGQISRTIEVNIVIDEFLEDDEQFKVTLSNPVNGFLKDNFQEAIGTIRNDDTVIDLTDEGYTSADSYPGMSLVWADEFDGTEINVSNWTYDIGDNGWGNNELQNYTSSSENSYINNGKLIILAKEIAIGQYTSARLKSIGLQEFQYGRIDVRALLPVDKGMWPAIWMLGSDWPISGWPACGEIDIVELVGSNPQRIHGTAHWGVDNSQHQESGQGISISFPETFADEFHVFSIEWEENSITWFLDDEEYFSLDSGDMNGQPYPFNQPFFFIMNVAVGGNWPGPPDETTTFPEFMAVDYVRVFQ